MTIHCAKGLEFPYVFLVGMEEDVFPNRQARETAEGLEEERRLFYVALTRAKSRMTLTGARRRRMMGQEMLGMPSRFLRELPAEVLEQPIRWGTELYQSGQGVMAGTRGPRTGGGGMGVASELARIRGYFDKARTEIEEIEAPDEQEPSEETVAQEPTSAPPPPPEVFDGNAWPKGTRIRSPRFGRGVILASSGRGDGLTYTVRFETGEKRIMARFGMLEREA
jgi:DNA helicase-2/ATP-dependent DNA helicase PcrA